MEPSGAQRPVEPFPARRRDIRHLDLPAALHARLRAASEYLADNVKRRPVTLIETVEYMLDELDRREAS
jgi:hypothetical protein